MNRLLAKIYQYREAIIHVLIWGGIISIVNVDWVTDWADRSIRTLKPSPVSVVLFPVVFYLNAFYLIPKFLKKKDWYLYFILTLGMVIIIEGMRSWIFNYLHPQALEFNKGWVKELWSKDSFLIGDAGSLLLAFFLSFGYRFTWDWVQNFKLIEKLKGERMKMELHLLKSQIDPHFLFNNLNALDDLIGKDDIKAKQYLHKLSNLYRYILVNMELDVVPLQEEWNYIKDYTYLIEERYGSAYHFDFSVSEEDISDLVIPPSSLQILIENVIKHNQGSPDDPLFVEISIAENGIFVTHHKRPKNSETERLGVGLTNLKARYKLLTEAEIIISNGAMRYETTLPLLRALKY